MYRYLRLATCASLILFGAVVAGGLMALVPSLLERLSTTRTQVSNVPTCANAEATPKGEGCMSWHELRVGTDVQPIEPNQAQASSEIDNPPERSLAKHAAPVPDQAIETPQITAPVQSSEVAAPVQSPQIAAPVYQTTPPPVHAEEHARAKPAHETKSRLSSLKRTARRERTAERRTHKALSAMRRFEDSRRDSPMSAYAAEGPPHRIIIRPTSIQDVYYYSARPWE